MNHFGIVVSLHVFCGLMELVSLLFHIPRGGIVVLHLNRL